jgi:hypothetical protein
VERYLAHDPQFLLFALSLLKSKVQNVVFWGPRNALVNRWEETLSCMTEHKSFCFAGQPAPCVGYFAGDVLPCICGVEGDVTTALSQVALPAPMCKKPAEPVLTKSAPNAA